MADKDNFEFKLGKWKVVMANGELEINNISYDQNDQEDDPTYDFVRHIFFKGDPD